LLIIGEFFHLLELLEQLGIFTVGLCLFAAMNLLRQNNESTGTKNKDFPAFKTLWAYITIFTIARASES
jgi:hypothetical protein